ncbi:MAG TPA: hypothetical protein VN176_05630 [Verrucomicrobiae bacterium]|nr:hypothetical protein [Verrucomicrobiae bacterium]
MVKTSLVFVHLLLFFVFLADGCIAQSAAAPAALAPELLQRIDAALRQQYNVPRGINISFSQPEPSSQPGFDQFIVTFSGGKNTSTHDFLISKDRKTLAHLEKIDLTKVDLPADLIAKINVKGRPIRGNQAAKVTIVSFDDFSVSFLLTHACHALS